MNDLAVVVLAHADPAHLARLVDALEDLPIFLHVDAKASRETRPPDLPARVRTLPRRNTKMASWSLVAAELSGLEAALASTRADHVAVLTGSDYPLVPVPELLEELHSWLGHSVFYNRSLPFPPWSTPRHPDGGTWRMSHRAITWRHNVVSWRGQPLWWPLPRDLPPGLELRASCQWKIYSREHAETLLHVTASRPDLVRFFRTSSIPEESFAASILGSRAVVGSAALRPCLANPWHYEFPPVGGHPKWLRQADFARLEEARRSPPINFGSAFVEDDKGLELPVQRKFFARKFSSRVDTTILDRIDEELRQ